MSRWFRLHDEILDDPKVQRLSGEDFKAWINLLCLASRNNGRLPAVEDIAFALRTSSDGAQTVLERLLNGGLIERRSGGADGAHYAPHNWNERQYKSDTSTDRVKRFRERSKTATETPPDTETETEKKTPKPPEGGRRGRNVIPEDWKLPDIADLPPKARACAEQWSPASYETHGEAFACYWRSERKMKSDWAATWANRVVALHSQVMRDQKFGNAPAEAGTTGKLAPEEQAKRFERQAETYQRLNRDDDAEECRRSAARLRNGSGARPIGDLISGMAGGTRQ